MEKTNVMRVLDQKKIKYEVLGYNGTEALPGEEAARLLGVDPATMFKTLVTVGKSGANYVFVVPVCGELDLKKAASAVEEKNIEMIKSKELLPLTGYVHGGCSPIGMKKRLRTVFDESARLLPLMIFSGGRIAHFVRLAPADAEKAVELTYAPLCRTEEGV